MKQLQDSKLVFFGKMTASTTHEMKNVFAIIKESSGLMEDIMSFTDDIPETAKIKLAKIIDKIKGQVERGNNLTQRINRFAHSSDALIADTDLNEIVSRLVNMSERLAKMKNISLELVPAADPIMITTKPVELLMAQFYCLEYLFYFLPDGGKVSATIKNPESKPTIRFQIESLPSNPGGKIDDATLSGKWSELEEICKCLNANATVDDKLCITITLPVKPTG
ncbi:MAG: hypothetical protein K9L30_02880 [Desulfobacterales bacterium]|nr:hypothetical protein [Desulfobacterales bacterium]